MDHDNNIEVAEKHETDYTDYNILNTKHDLRIETTFGAFFALHVMVM